ncbi:MAG TPA: flagellar biosynthetic protein FliR [Vitreimonas sp.]|uniref:flagellar biosynthetic protein FliR n=1 Tax=Vitreimonas sp. TaxID=3069702 RepID=UPI002D75D85E|nr:flagellar biosynthetic protein FliR [Vitreimonas sp.]HYD85975.1 flagellar biosynthetic protein FliR [Vitreimonas sp.]
MTIASGFADQLIATLLISLRIAPVFAFAPPITLTKTPAVVRLLLALALGFWMAVAHADRIGVVTDEALVSVAAGELMFGLSTALALQLAFAALLTAGRALDIQVGFGLAQVADPTFRTQMPLVGSLFIYAAGAVFFATDGPADLVAIWSQSIEAAPPGSLTGPTSLGGLLGYVKSIFVLAMGLAGAVFLTLFLVDLTIAFMSRTLPQMNMLVLGFQVKTIALLATLPFVFAFSGALFLRIVRLAIDAVPELL